MHLSAFITVFSCITLVTAKAAGCLVHDIAVIKEQILRVGCSLDKFRGSEGHPESKLIPCDMKPLFSIYTQGAELDALLQDLIDDLQESCPFNLEDSGTILSAFAALEEPLTSILDAFKSKHCDFVNALGAFMTHRIIGGNIKSTRCKIMQVIKALAFKVEDPYKEIVRCAGYEIDSQFQAVICGY